MMKRPCPVEHLITSNYCQLSVCMECRIVNLNIPARISFQFEIQQFFEIADAFNKAAHILKVKLEPKPKRAKIVELNCSIRDG
jgi:hypothetical protein